MLPIQIFLLALFALALIKVVMKYYRGELSSGTAISWIIFWLLAAAIVAQPDLTSTVAKLFGVGRGADVVVYLAFGSLVFLVLSRLVKIEKLNREITTVVREKALKDNIKSL